MHIGALVLMVALLGACIVLGWSGGLGAQDAVRRSA